MSKLQEKAWSDRILDTATLITEGTGIMKTYDLNDGSILKLIKPKEEVPLDYLPFYYDFIDNLYKKLYYANYIDDESIVLPETVYFDEELKGYVVPKVTGKKELSMILEKPNISYDTLKVKSDCLIALSEKVKMLNREGIIIPDLANVTNTFVGNSKDDFSFIDYDGLQISDASSYSMSSLLGDVCNTLLCYDKYFNRYEKLYTDNLDKFSLLLLFIYYTTNKNISSDISTSLLTFLPDEDEPKPDSKVFEEFFSSLGISDTDISILIENSYNIKTDNEYPEESIKKLVKDYDLVPTSTRDAYFKKKSIR